jgi:hypothetical protein
LDYNLKVKTIKRYIKELCYIIGMYINWLLSDIGASNRYVIIGDDMVIVTRPVTEMSGRSIFWGGKGGRCVRLTTLPPSFSDCLEIWEP